MQPASEKKSVLIVADTLFCPVRRNGVSIRYYHLVRELTDRGYVVDIIVINRYAEEYRDHDIGELGKICNAIDIIDLDHLRRTFAGRLFRGARNMLRLVAPFGMPYCLVDNNRDYLVSRISELLDGRSQYLYGIGVEVGGGNADMLLCLEDSIRPEQIICDFIDSAYLLRKRARKWYQAVINPITFLEDIKTRGWEKSMCGRCKCIYISEEDARTAGNSEVYIIPNSIVEDGFNSSSKVMLESPNIAFFGNMSYRPNIEACLYLGSEILPGLKPVFPEISLYIVGRNPGRELVEKCNDPSIHIIGEVENIWDYIQAADLFVFPLLSGAGLQNKVLEAMYAGKVVVTSPIGNEGINAVHGRDIYVAHTLEDYIFYIEKALSNDDGAGGRAREFIQENFSVSGFVNSYLALLTAEDSVLH